MIGHVVIGIAIGLVGGLAWELVFGFPYAGVASVVFALVGMSASAALSDRAARRVHNLHLSDHALRRLEEQRGRDGVA
jgi:membrane protein implicated in regulation of membrane protease activity